MNEGKTFELELRGLTGEDRSIGDRQSDGASQVATAHFLNEISNFAEVEVNPLRDALERGLALVVLICSLPVCAALAVMIRLDSPGPVLFRQWRVGRGGRLFRFTKFRTYYADAAERFPDHYRYSYTPEEVERLHFKNPDDPRATKIGARLRKSTLDELPNFWHVVTGDMAWVGPRPEIPEMLPYYRTRELRKFSVRPGITGTAQTSGRGWLSFRDTVRLDLEYIEKQSPKGDLKIIFDTIVSVVLRRGAF
jgi:lipopolysaccharide/colanic/teichoic acid biosynthesis glycosyltransferase